MQGLFAIACLLLLFLLIPHKARAEDVPAPEEAVRAVIGDGELLGKPADAAAVADVMRRAERGEDLTIALIGGSITMGTVSVGTLDAAYPGRECYYAHFCRWWRTRFPKARFTFVNAGIGGTDSYLGVHRVRRDVLSRSPDLVLIEFSVNDDGRLPMTPVSYNSLARRVLERCPAVMLLFMAQTNGATAADVHRRTGDYYHLPMVPLNTVFSRLIEKGVIPAEALSGDEVHPSALGHAVTGALLSRFLDLVRDLKESAGAQPLPPSPVPDPYPLPDLLTGGDDFPHGRGSFTPGAENEFYPAGWTHLDGDAPFTADITCRTLGILYLRTVDGMSGSCEVRVDGQPAAVLDGDFPGGWGRAITAKEVLRGSEVRTRHIELDVLPGGGKQWILLGFLISR